MYPTIYTVTRDILSHSSSLRTLIFNLVSEQVEYAITSAAPTPSGFAEPSTHHVLELARYPDSIPMSWICRNSYEVLLQLHWSCSVGCNPFSFPQTWLLHEESRSPCGQKRKKKNCWIFFLFVCLASASTFALNFVLKLASEIGIGIGIWRLASTSACWQTHVVYRHEFDGGCWNLLGLFRKLIRDLI
ncbi:hypothetical protein DVH24_042493 [Malus domestica]|uniref:Uncharacterized protein n=1 Tax=Malus domestica TaxID=3750 RepID=A0A498JA86_MALDO|nr:hypothetical protein DVH24_042493 [Malus domestica]